MQDKSLIYWATIEHHRWWLCHDQVYLNLLAQEGQLRSWTVRLIAKAYGVNRGIPRAADPDAGDPAATAIADVLGEAAHQFSGTLSQRFAICAEILQQLPPGIRGAEPATPKFVSGTTKLMWFLRPSGWTMFDNFAANALGIARGKSSVRARLFYAALEKQGFSQKSEAGNAVIRASGIPELHAERVIDKYLWLAGCTQPAREKAKAICEAYLQGLPSKHAEDLQALASALTNLLGENPFSETGGEHYAT
ncbi:hypothetical protein B5K08_05485 [Rhizobium leguminosarum bv. trifolii]|uniref:Uncharacterized protein n=1 Tax=Rhizobium leguminosarum bv. trifolii TaxID=386 RepID=A0A3E1BY15_RHILT|nr:hypothetical protein [Rhizobium leguminosarum]RFB98002.1 hypothetical protein B5K08_05485 [Rhizobium leguminosarum bv. trifolii]RFB99955.1 hypothetical protein B5K10_05475 [Rhizobium leguminosarum bv. trifolii]